MHQCIKLATRACVIQKGEKASSSGLRMIGQPEQPQRSLRVAKHDSTFTRRHLSSRKCPQFCSASTPKDQHAPATPFMCNKGESATTMAVRNQRGFQPAITCAISTLRQQRAFRVCQTSASRKQCQNLFRAKAFWNHLQHRCE